MRDDGSFDINQFFQDLAIQTSEQAEVEDCLIQGLAAYYRYIYGYDKYGEYPNSLIQERIYVPFVFGFGAVEAVRRPVLAIETRQKMVQYTLQQIDPYEEYGVPYGLPILLSCSARTGSLSAPVFRWIWLLTTAERREVFDEWKKDELFSLIDWITNENNLPQDEPIWWLQHLSTQCDKPHLSKVLADYLLQHVSLSTSFKLALCRAWLSKEPAGAPPVLWKAFKAQMHEDSVALETVLSELPTTEREGVAQQAEMLADIGAVITMFSIMVENNAYLSQMPNALKRRAVLALTQLGEDALQICQTYLDSDDGYAADAINQGVADVIRVYSSDLPRDAVQALVEQGVKSHKLTTRKAFFKLGADLFGPEYLTRAQKDKTKSVRDWSTKQMAGTKAPSGRSKHTRH